MGGPAPADRRVSDASPDDLAAVAEEAARAAGALLLERFEAGTERATATKSSPTDLVSEADHAAEDAIRATLAARRPDDAIVGEEGDDVAGTTGLRWIVDPLDGTVNFLFGIPQWCVSIACEGDAGVVYDPLREELFCARAGGDPRLNGVPIERPARDDLATAMVATGFGYERSVREAQVADRDPRHPARARHPPRRQRGPRPLLDGGWAASTRSTSTASSPGTRRPGLMLCEGVGLHVERLPAAGALPEGVLAAPPAIAAELRALVTRGG